jgi:hypothetical protein
MTRKDESLFETGNITQLTLQFHCAEFVAGLVAPDRSYLNCLRDDRLRKRWQLRGMSRLIKMSQERLREEYTVKVAL